MEITLESAQKAGTLVTYNYAFTDEELAIALQTTRLVLAYFEGRGRERYYLITRILEEDIRTLERFVEGRKCQ